MANQPLSITFKGKAFVNESDTGYFTDDLQRAINRAIRVSVEEQARALTSRIVNTFENQSLPHKPLNPLYKAGKIRDGLDPRIGFRTNTMVKSIKFFKDSDTKFFVGIRRQQRTARRNAPVTTNIPTYAKFFEFGTIKQPARPVFIPLFRASKNRFNSAIMKTVDIALKDIQRVWSAGRA